MQYPYLKYFIITTQYMSISKAAEAIHISQQGLSSYIRRLESYYQVELFHRKPELSLTSAGEILLKKAEVINQAFEELEQDLLNRREQEREVNMAIITPALRYVRDHKLLVQFRDFYPDTVVQMENLSEEEEIVRSVLNHTVDFGITSVLQENRQADYTYLFSQKFVLAISDEALRKYIPDYPDCIEDFRRGVDLKDFLSVPYYGYPDNYSVSLLIADYCRREGISLNTKMKNPSPKSSIQMVALGHGFAILVKDRLPVFRKEIKRLGLSFLAFPIREPDLRVPYCMVRRADNSVYPPYVEKLMELVQTSMKEGAH